MRRRQTQSAGIRQFLDVGTGLPSANNTHEVAQAVAPESRVLYVDNDPIVPRRESPCAPAPRSPASSAASPCSSRAWS